MSVALFTFYGDIMASTATVAINHQKQGSENFRQKYFSTFFNFCATICLHCLSFWAKTSTILSRDYAFSALGDPTLTETNVFVPC
jgi:hypothetical protein